MAKSLAPCLTDIQSVQRVLEPLKCEVWGERGYIKSRQKYLFQESFVNFRPGLPELRPTFMNEAKTCSFSALTRTKLTSSCAGQFMGADN